MTVQDKNTLLNKAIQIGVNIPHLNLINVGCSVGVHEFWSQ